MKLIIEVPNSLYANIKSIPNGTAASDRLLRAVKAGTPLSEYSEGTSRIDKISLREIKLPLRVCHALNRAGYETIGDLRGVNQMKLRSIRNIGRDALLDIKLALYEYGVELPLYAEGVNK